MLGILAAGGLRSYPCTCTLAGPITRGTPLPRTRECLPHPALLQVHTIAQHTLRAMLLDTKAAVSSKPSAAVAAIATTAHVQARLTKGVLALFGNCPAADRKQLVDKASQWLLLCVRLAP